MRVDAAGRAVGPRPAAVAVKDRDGAVDAHALLRVPSEGVRVGEVLRRLRARHAHAAAVKIVELERLGRRGEHGEEKVDLENAAARKGAALVGKLRALEALAADELHADKVGARRRGGARGCSSPCARSAARRRGRQSRRRRQRNWRERGRRGRCGRRDCGAVHDIIAAQDRLGMQMCVDGGGGGVPVADGRAAHALERRDGRGVALDDIEWTAALGKELALDALEARLLARCRDALADLECELVGKQGADGVEIVGHAVGNAERRELDRRVLEGVARRGKLAADGRSGCDTRAAALARARAHGLVRAHKGGDARELGERVEEDLIKDDEGKGAHIHGRARGIVVNAETEKAVERDCAEALAHKGRLELVGRDDKERRLFAARGGVGLERGRLSDAWEVAEDEDPIVRFEERRHLARVALVDDAQHIHGRERERGRNKGTRARPRRSLGEALADRARHAPAADALPALRLGLRRLGALKDERVRLDGEEAARRRRRGSLHEQRALVEAQAVDVVDDVLDRVEALAERRPRLDVHKVEPLLADAAHEELRAERLEHAQQVQRLGLAPKEQRALGRIVAPPDEADGDVADELLEIERQRARPDAAQRLARLGGRDEARRREDALDDDAARGGQRGEDGRAQARDDARLLVEQEKERVGERQTCRPTHKVEGALADRLAGVGPEAVKDTQHGVGLHAQQSRKVSLGKVVLGHLGSGTAANTERERRRAGRLERDAAARAKDERRAR